jgi:hypothetical protein
MTRQRITRSGDDIKPLARTHELITRAIPGELLIYDLKRHNALCLNETAALVWKKCDGHNTVEDLTAELESRYGSPVDPRIVWLALDQFEKSHLLAVNAAQPKSSATITRRQVMQAAFVAAIALPVITIIVAPTAASAATTITVAACQARRQSDPGGCGGNPCVGGGTCVPQGGTRCRCG